MFQVPASWSRIASQVARRPASAGRRPRPDQLARVLDGSFSAGSGGAGAPFAADCVGFVGQLLPFGFAFVRGLGDRDQDPGGQSPGVGAQVDPVGLLLNGRSHANALSAMYQVLLPCRSPEPVYGPDDSPIVDPARPLDRQANVILRAAQHEARSGSGVTLGHPSASGCAR